MGGQFRSIKTLRAILILYLCTFLVFPAVAHSRTQQKPKKLNIAVMDFTARGGISKEEAATLSDAFQNQMVNMGEFIVVDRQRIKQILDEQGFQQSEACSQVECIVEAGKILKVERMFAGVIGKVGTIFNVNIQAIDISTAQIVSNKNRQHRGEIEDLLSDIIPQIADEMAADMLGKKIKSSTSSSGSSSWLWYVGGVVVVGGGVAAVLLKKEETPPNTVETQPLPDSPDPPPQ